jgi:hypothetical protein
MDPKTVAIGKQFLMRVAAAAAKGASEEAQRTATGAAIPLLARAEAIGQGLLSTVRAAREALERRGGG